MDERLAKIAGGERFHRIQKSDLDRVAPIIAAGIFKFVQVSRTKTGDVEYVRFLGSGVDLSILASDWDRLMPYIEADYFSSMAYPTYSGYRFDPSKFPFDGSPYQRMYDRVYDLLVRLFPDDYSNMEM